MSVESGIRPLRLEFARETTEGEPPTDPTWLRFSDSVQSFSLTPTPTITERRNIGSPDVFDHVAGAEAHEFEVTYDLQQWFVDGSGDPLDAAGDGLLRDSATGETFNTHTVVARRLLGGNGAAGADTNSYVFDVAEGSTINEVSCEGAPDSGEPLVVTLSYMCEKLRSYRVDQPASSTTLEVVSSDAADTTQTITIEDVDAGTSEQVALNGTTPVTTTASFATIDAARLDAETVGNVTISDGTNNLMTIYGSAAYQDREGDLGVPLLGSGSHASAIGGEYEVIVGDTIERPAGTELLGGMDINSASFTVSNNLEQTARVGNIGMRISDGPRDVNLDASVFGERASYESMVEHLQNTSTDIVWTMTGGTLTFPGAVLTSLGTIALETDQAVMIVDNTFTSEGLTIA